jgi:uncharacterized protein YjbJ (UPF0337 family)
MSTSDSTIKGKFDEIAGKAKQAFGEATGNESVANHGAGQEVKGHAEQSWGAVKEAAHDNTTGTSTTTTSTGTGTTGHDIREKVTSTAANVKESIRNATNE